MKYGFTNAGHFKLLALTTLSLGIFNVNAEETLPSINYIEAGYIDMEIDDFLTHSQANTVDFKGSYLDGRYGLFSNFYINLGIKTTISDSVNFDLTRNFGGTSVNLKGTTELEFNEQRLGFGYTIEPSDNWRITADINYFRQRYIDDRTGTATVTGDINDVPINFRTIADRQVTLDGGLVRVGTEYAVTSDLTLQGNVTYQNISGDGFRLKGARLNLVANYQFAKNWAFIGNYQISNENALYLGVRYSF